MSEWQPIETAPKNGTVFIIGRVGVNAYSGTAFWEKGHFRDPMDWDARYWVDPTDWMPLPAPPSRVQAVGE